MSRDIARLNDTQIAVAIRRQLTDAESARRWHIMSFPKPKFRYADFPVLESFAEVGVMEFGLKEMSWVCLGLVADVTGKSV